MSIWREGRSPLDCSKDSERICRYLEQGLTIGLFLSGRQPVRLGKLHENQPQQTIDRKGYGSAGPVGYVNQPSQKTAQKTNLLALYAAMRHEADLQNLWKPAQQAGWHLCFPAVTGPGDQAGLVFVTIPDDRNPDGYLQPGRFGVSEPPVPAAAGWSACPEVMIMPGLAFDLQGYRLGWGKGYYDRFLASLPGLPILIGAAYDGQVLPEIPHEAHDYPVDWIVTPSGIRKTGVGSFLFSVKG